MAPPIQFIFEGEALLRPSEAVMTFEEAIDAGYFEDAAASVLAASEGLKGVGVHAPDFFSAVDQHPPAAETERDRYRLWLGGLIRVLSPTVWTGAMARIGAEGLRSRRFADIAELLEAVRANLKNGDPSGALDIRMEREEVDGKQIVHLHLPGDILAVGVGPPVLEQVLRQAFSHFDPLDEIVIDFASPVVSLESPLVQTWGFVERLSPDLFPPTREIGLQFKFSEDLQISYRLFRGEKELRKTYYDPRGVGWEVLELGSPENRYAVLVRERSEKPLVVEVHIDPNVTNYTYRSTQQIFSDAAGVIMKRKGLEKIVLVMETDHRGSRDFAPLAKVIVQTVFSDTVGYEGFIELAVVRGETVLEFCFKREHHKVVLTGTHVDTLRTFPRPPHLYPEPHRELEVIVGAPAVPQEGGPITPAPLMPTAPAPPKKTLRDLLRTPVSDLWRSRRK